MMANVVEDCDHLWMEVEAEYVEKGIGFVNTRPTWGQLNWCTKCGSLWTRGKGLAPKKTAIEQAPTP